MKKVLIAVLVIMTVFCASVFANDGYEDYSGITFGIGYSGASIKYLGAEWKETSNPITITASEYAFFQGSPVGLYAEIGVEIPFRFKRNDVATDDWVAGVIAGIGPAFRFEAGDGFAVMLGAGFHFYSTTKSITSTHKIERNYFGAGVELSASYKIGRHFAFNAGVAASLFFANYNRDMYRGWSPIDISYDSYSELRAVPKLGFYYVY